MGVLLCFVAILDRVQHVEKTQQLMNFGMKQSETFLTVEIFLNCGTFNTVALTSEYKDVTKLKVMLRYVVTVMYFLVNFPF